MVLKKRTRLLRDKQPYHDRFHYSKLPINAAQIPIGRFHVRYLHRISFPFQFLARETIGHHAELKRLAKRSPVTEGRTRLSVAKAGIDPLPVMIDRLERGLKKVTKLAFHLRAQTDDAMNLIFQLQEERRRLATVADALSRKLFEKAINEWVEEERELQQRLRNPRTTGGFNPQGKQ